jgi:hypothetical protein
VTAPREDLGPAMRRLRKALEARMRADDARDRRETAKAARRKADGELVSYDTRGLALVLRPALEWDGRGWAVIAAEIGVTSPDLSRVMAGQDISAGKVFAICDWLGVEPRRFYRPLKGQPKRFAGWALLRRAQRGARMFHGKSTETDRGEGGSR